MRGKQCFSGVGVERVFFSNLLAYLIVNVGEDDIPDRGNFEVHAYTADKGELVWSRIFESSPKQSILIDDKLYFDSGLTFYRLDAATGEIEMAVNHDLSRDENGYSRACFYPADDVLICQDQDAQLIQIRSFDGKEILQTIRLPEAWTVYGAQPVEYHGAYFIPLTGVHPSLNGISGAYIKLLIDESADKKIQVEMPSRPLIVTEKTIGEKKAVSFVIKMSHDNLLEVIRYCTIRCKEIAFSAGKSQIYPTLQDKKFNGEITVCIDPKPLAHMKLSNDQLLEELQVIKERVEKGCKDSWVKNGQGKGPISVTVCLP